MRSSPGISCHDGIAFMYVLMAVNVDPLSVRNSLQQPVKTAGV